MHSVRQSIYQSRVTLASVVAGLVLVTAVGLFAQPGETGGNARVLDINGPIGPATRDYLLRGIEAAADEGAPVVILRMDTPGGLVVSTRDIVGGILNARVPVVSWVGPAGSRAASAGTYIFLASHVATMARSTTIGAATPVAMGGDGLPGAPPQEDDSGRDEGGDEGESEDGRGPGEGERPGPSPAGAAERKAIEDAVAWIRSLAERHDRNADWAEQAVRAGATLTDREALDDNVADLGADTLPDLLAALDGRVVTVDGREVTLTTAGLEIIEIEPDWRSELLAVITNPTLAYILFIIGIYGLVLEGYNPGSLVPGVIGGICLILALYAFQVLPVNYAGLALIVLGFALILAELFVPSFGILGIGGVVAVIFGSIILMDTDMPGYVIPTGFLVGVGATAGLLFFGVMYLVVRSQRRGRVSGVDTLIGRPAEVIEDFVGGRGRVHVEGEDWSARSGDSLRHGDSVRIKAVDGLVLEVEATGERQ